MGPYRYLEPRPYPGSTPAADRPTVGFRFAPDKSAANVDTTALEAALETLGVTPEDAAALRGAGDAPAVLAAFARTCLALLRRAGHGAAFAHLAPDREPGHWQVQLPYEDLETILRAGDLARKAIEKPDSGPAVEAFMDFARDRALDPNAALFVDAARRLGLPWLNLDQPPFETQRQAHPVTHGLIQVGHGCRRRLVLGSLPDHVAPVILERLGNRHALLGLLAGADIPVPAQDPESPNVNRRNRALRAAERLGRPVTLSAAQVPVQEWPGHVPARYGPLHDADQVAAAFDAASRHSRAVTVEAYVPGDSYRLLVLGDRVHSAVRRRPPTLTGNGQHTVRELLERRLARASTPAARRAWRRLVAVDEDLLTRLSLHGLAPDAVPARGREIALRTGATPHQGGEYRDAADVVAGEPQALALRAARACGVEGFCAVDMVIADNETTVVDVTAGPDLTDHDDPARGTPAEALLRHWFPDPDAARIPLIAVTGTNGKSTTCHMLAHVLGHAGHCVGLVTTEGASIGGKWLQHHDLAGTYGAQMVLADSRTEVAVLETARGGIIKFGMPADRFAIGACLNVARDHIGEDGVYDLDQMAEVKRAVVDAARDAVVLGADDPRCLAMGDPSGGRELWLVAESPDNPALADHAASGGRGLCLAQCEGRTHLARLDREGILALVAVDDIPATWQGRARYNAINALFAAAIALAHGVPEQTVADALVDFRTDWRHCPGRLNRHSGLPFELILDAAHNPQKYAALAGLVRQLPCRGAKRLVCFTRHGYAERDTRAVAAAVAESFDVFYCRDPKAQGHPDYIPGRPAGQLRDALVAEGVDPSRIRVSAARQDAEARALDESVAGDLLVICAMKHGATRKRLDEFAASLAGN